MTYPIGLRSQLFLSREVGKCECYLRNQLNLTSFFIFLNQGCFKVARDYVPILNLPSFLTQSGGTSSHVPIKETQVTKP